MKNGHWEYQTCTVCNGCGMQSNGEEMCNNCKGEGKIKVWVEDKKN
ncbi:MAG: hypothetical protein ACFFDF_03835 [Candidatus Odinarchaeota archaeon]